MWVHWTSKVMKFTHEDKRIKLQGLQQDKGVAATVKGHKLRGLLRKQAITHCIQLQLSTTDLAQQDSVALIASVARVQETPIPQEVQQLLKVYEDLFQTPTSLPPPRPFDHQIQLVPGAQPINVRPYRYSPLQKDEIERQLAEILKSGIIKHSNNP